MSVSRNFDGANDRITFGSDASIDAFALQSCLAWVKRGATAAAHCIIAKDRAIAAWTFQFTNTDLLELYHDWSTNAQFGDSTSTVGTSITQVAGTLDTGVGTNLPTLWINNVQETLSASGTGSGTVTSDAAASLVMGELGPGSADLNGDLQWVVYDNITITAEHVNRHYWWGFYTGPSSVKVWYPLLVNEATVPNRGTATAVQTAVAGTTASSAIPRGQRNWDM